MAVPAHVLRDLGHPPAETFTRQAMRADLDDTDRTGTSYGIHLGAIAAALRLATVAAKQAGTGTDARPRQG